MAEARLAPQEEPTLLQVQQALCEAGLSVCFGMSGGKLKVYRDPEPAVAPADAPPQLTEARVLEFIGWLSADIDELHQVEIPRLADSWERFKVRRAADAPAKGDQHD